MLSGFYSVQLKTKVKTKMISIFLSVNICLFQSPIIFQKSQYDLRLRRALFSANIHKRSAHLEGLILVSGSKTPENEWNKLTDKL